MLSGDRIRLGTISIPFLWIFYYVLQCFRRILGFGRILKLRRSYEAHEQDFDVF